MKLRLLKVKSLKEGRALLCEALDRLELKKTLQRTLGESLGYILAEDIRAREDIPGFNRSAVDGFALVAATTYGASEVLPTVLKIVEDIPMGEVPHKAISPGEASRVMTGGMLPEGADAVVMIEDTQILGEDLLAVYAPLSAYDHVVEIGEDCRKGELFFSKGRRITPKIMAGCASLGYEKIHVYAPLRVAILSTGDELLAPGEAPTPGKTRDVNRFALEGLCKALGMDVIQKTHVRDDKKKLREALASPADILLVSGSSSQGDKDYLAELIEELSPGLLFHGLAIKPGKPTILGSDGKKIILGLPGHPMSSYIVFKALLEEALRDFYGLEEKRYLPAFLSHNMAATPGRTSYQPVALEEKEGQLWAKPLFGSSGSLSVLARAQGYFILEDHEEGASRQDRIKVYPLD